jgi:hypothetical protein
VLGSIGLEERDGEAFSPSLLLLLLLTHAASAWLLAMVVVLFYPGHVDPGALHVHNLVFLRKDLLLRTQG